MTNEVKAALFTHGNQDTLVISRIYGLGGKDFYAEDGHHFFELAIGAATESGCTLRLLWSYARRSGQGAEARHGAAEI